MKLIIAVLRPTRFQAAMDLLERLEVKVLAFSDVQVMDRRNGWTGTYRGLEHAVKVVPGVRLEIAADDDDVDMVIQAILAGARDGDGGKLGDGRVLVLPLEQAVRIRPDGRAMAL